MTAAAEFVRYLEDSGMASLDILDVDLETAYWNCFKIQKYAFIAREFGLEMPHEYDVDRAGPYSRTLAQEYYDLAGDPEAYGRVRGVPNAGFDAEGFRRAVDGRNNKWLRVATTLIECSGEEATHGDLVDRVKISEGASKKYISGVLSELEGAGLVRLRS